MYEFSNDLIFELDDEFVTNGFQLVTKEEGPPLCGTDAVASGACAYGDEAYQIQRCISNGCNLILWCPSNGEGLDEPSCHNRHGGKSRACIRKNCQKCTKDSCNYKSPNDINGGKKFGHWYAYFKDKGNIKQHKYLCIRIHNF